MRSPQAENNIQDNTSMDRVRCAILKENLTLKQDGGEGFCGEKMIPMPHTGTQKSQASKRSRTSRTQSIDNIDNSKGDSNLESQPENRQNLIHETEGKF